MQPVEARLGPRQKLLIRFIIGLNVYDGRFVEASGRKSAMLLPRRYLVLEVITLEDARSTVTERFDGKGSGVMDDIEIVRLDDAMGRALSHDIVAEEGVPPFDRSTVDGFAVIASDTFGCTDSLPALLELAGEVEMGFDPTCSCAPGACVRIPTGGKLPEGADSVVMLEYCEEYGDGTVGVARPVAPGDNIVFAGDDVKPGQVLIDAGTRLQAHHLGTLASLGYAECAVLTRPRVAIVSTGDEIVPVGATPVASQMRDVNMPVLAAAVEACGAQAVRFPIVPDDHDTLLACMHEALSTCDVVLVSGGSSAGAKDNTARVLAELGTLLFHGVAVKPGKPTMCADVQGKPVFGLPGHPVAAYFLFLELVRPLLAPANAGPEAVAALASAVPSNHGRAELVPVKLERVPDGMRAHPVHGKSGLISQLAHADGYVEVPRNQEGLPAGAPVSVKLF